MKPLELAVRRPLLADRPELFSHESWEEAAAQCGMNGQGLGRTQGGIGLGQSSLSPLSCWHSQLHFLPGALTPPWASSQPWNLQIFWPQQNLPRVSG